MTILRVAESEKALDTSLLKPQEDSLGCPACGGAVFPLECVKAGNASYHRGCLACRLCAKKLTPAAVILEEGGKVYCRPCHKTTFPTGGYSIPDPALIQALPASLEGCQACGGKVYEPERVSSKTGIYHKNCFSCHQCKKKLDSTLVYAFEAPDTHIYCKKCFTDKFGEGRSPLLWTDTTTILPMDGQGCPRCGGAVFKQEEVIEKGRNFHKRCFTCKKCNRPQADKLQVFVGFDSEIYCKGCYPGVGHSGADKQDTSVIPGHEEGCPRCGGKVFEAERFMSKKKQFHKSCFTCFSCRSPLSLSSMFETPDGEIACKVCYLQHYFTGGRNAYLDYSKVGESQCFGPVCPVCKADVYEAEKVKTKSHSYHKKCLTCAACRRALDASSYYEGSDKMVYCKGCYTSTFGDLAPAANEEMIHFPATVPGDTKCCGCGSKVFQAEKMLSSFGVFHRQCYKCVDCSSLLHTSKAYKYKGENLYCKTCVGHAKEKARAAGEDDEGSLVYATAMVETETIKADEDDPDRCPRCCGKVFPAEKMSMRNGNYHRTCFSCGQCKRQLDYQLACDGPSGDIFCNNCYFQNFGPLTHGIDGSSSIDTSSIKPKKEQSGCPRCGGAVFKTEEVLSKGQAFHKRCATCAMCSRVLDTRSLCAGEADDKEIYCSGCYRAKYRGTRPSTPLPPGSIPATEGEEACQRCKGRLFQPERVQWKDLAFHRACFSCKECSRSLDLPGAHAVKGEDGEVYCTRCHANVFPGGGGKAWADPALIVAKDGQGCPR